MKKEIENHSDKWKFKLCIKTMLSGCSKCRRNTESKNPKVVKTKNGRIEPYIKTMLYYCSKCRKNVENKNTKIVKTKNGRIMLLSKCEVCNCKKLKFIKEQKARGLLSTFTEVKVLITNSLTVTNILL